MSEQELVEEGNPKIGLPSLQYALSMGWRDDASCSKLDKAIFFDYQKPALSVRVRKQYLKIAMSTCESCPVKDRCYEFAVKNDERYGIWAGTTPDQRKSAQLLFKKSGTLEVLPTA